jgi:hypothetical protein
MATSAMIEEERGTFNDFYRRHNGYYAGDFSRRANSSGDGTGHATDLLPADLAHRARAWG